MKNFLDGFDTDLKRGLKEQLHILWTYTSNAIEGSTLSLGDTEFVIKEGLTVAGQPLKFQTAAVNHYRAIDIIDAMANNALLSGGDILNLHKHLMLDAPIDIYSPVGAWKNDRNGTYHIIDEKSVWVDYPGPEQIPALMTAWVELFNQTKVGDEFSAAKAYALLHTTFTAIHPFFDGNGRMARLLANIPVIKAGLVPIVLDSQQRREYIAIMQNYSLTGNGLELNRPLDEIEHFVRASWNKSLELVRQTRHIQETRNRNE